MKVGQMGLILPGIILLAVIALLTVAIVRRGKSKRKIRRMTMPQKVRQLNALTEPFGFLYIADQDVFSTCRDAWQRRMGYEALFDRAAIAAHIVIDAQPVYFDYDGRTWMIEFWKGQYGISTGGEVGIYHAEGIVPPEYYESAHFDAAEDFELPYIKSRLVKGEEILYELEAEHWWLTGFVMGMFSSPEKLHLYTSVTFARNAMAEAFLAGLDRSAIDHGCYRRCGNSVCVEMLSGGEVSPVQRLHRAWAQLCNCFWARVFCTVTAPFGNTADRMLFLYYQLPWCFRRILKRCRKRCGYPKRKYRRKCRGRKCCGRKCRGLP